MDVFVLVDDESISGGWIIKIEFAHVCLPPGSQDVIPHWTLRLIGMHGVIKQ